MARRPCLVVAIVQDDHGSLHDALRTLSHWRFVVFATLGLIAVGIWLMVLKAPALCQHKLLLAKPALVTTLSAFTAAVCGALSQTFLKIISEAIASTPPPQGSPSPWFACTAALTAYDASHLRPFTAISLARNGLNAEASKAVAAVLDKTQITSLKCASHPAQRLTFARPFVHLLAFASAAFDADNCSPPLLAASIATG